ncbi:DNA topoisomerase IV subunit A [Rhodoferax antarcticus]|uniref:DNA topoisomerase 4 subunit A n=1 Tax=Rhodoferax antarcticus ANT.BR TaxID=1111071 RepID=A0A1Q8YC74_9BURK|nr:DNA topoisomerase IV subunit A [Rhodoferax antarcticus]APW46889.1 DNA topoisomerase IV subunit A [Rhodoferax antarcticus]OLP05410.1 DNA topoisomerase IV, A subunit [Rhodoferax antarcticus ANT.BR]
MTDQPIIDLLTPSEPGSDDELNLASYAQRAYLEYALSVVKGRALPDVCDGQKPVQRRILYAMSRMGLGFGGTNGNVGAKPVKCARVVGDVLGRYHPHGDSAAYDALVRMAQDFSQRYPLIDGQGNFGSRDGDGAAAMRYTEARLAKITSLLLDEIDEGTVDFTPNYDGSTEEPRRLPARLPFALLNGASGIAVGLATEIPSHNLREVADACVALIKSPTLTEDELFALVPGPDYPGGGQIISSAGDIADAYRSGRGSLKCRARWKIEDLARGQWQLVVTELPPGVSTQRVLEEIEDISNPKVKAGKKALSLEQNQLKATLLSVLDGVRDESSKDAAVRLVCEPKTSRISQQELINTLLAHTSLETSSPINLTMIGLDGRPTQKSLRQMFTEWIAFRQTTIERRSRHRLNKVLERIHILEGRALVLLNIDEVIAIIRQADDPKAALIERFKLSSAQAEDILEIRLRQLARLEAIKIEQELSTLRTERQKLEEILGSPATLRRLMIKEIELDAKTFADPRRTLIQAEKKVVLEVKVVDEPVTVVVSQKGWVRAQKGWAKDKVAAAATNGTSSATPADFTFKAGDALYGSFECRTVDTLLAFGSNGRVYSVPLSLLPGGRGDGQPITSLIELEAGTQLLYYFAGPASASLLLCSSGGYGFMATVEQMTSKFKAGKAFVTVNAGETLCAPSVVVCDAGSVPLPAASHVACASTGGRILSFELSELRTMPNGGRGLMLIDLEDKDTLAGACAYIRSVSIEGLGRSGKPREETLEIRSLNNARAVRGRKGKLADLGFKPQRVSRVL